MRLMKWREDAQLSREALAEKLGISGAKSPYQLIRNYELGLAAVPITLVPHIMALTCGTVTLPDLIEPRTEFLKARNNADEDAVVPSERSQQKG